MELLKVVQTEARGFRLIGEVDLSCLELLDPIDTAAAAASGGDLHLDLSRLTFVDGAALDRIAAVARTLGDKGKLRLLRPQRSVERSLRRIAGPQQLDNLVFSRIRTVLPETPDPAERQDLAKILVSDHSPESACRLVAGLAASVPGTLAASIVMRNRDSLLCAGFDSPLGENLANAEIAAGEGPCTDALESGVRQTTASLVTETRWPDFARVAMHSGIASVLAEPLMVSGSAFGTLALFGGRENVYRREESNEAAGLAARGALVIANAILYWQEVEHARQFREALESRAVIDQAKGVLMAREAISAEEAFATLLRASQASNTKVRDLAQNLVEAASTTRQSSL